MPESAGALSRPRGRRTLAAMVFVGGVLLALGATTFPDPTATHLIDRPFCLRCGDLAGTDLALNLFLFAPLGAGVAMLGGRARHAILIGALLSLGIEALQLDLIPGRDASIRDLLANAAGAGLGALIPARARLFLRPTAPLARTLTLVAAGAALAVLGIGGWAIRPDAPYRIYWVQWTPVRFGYDAFRGTLRQLRLAGVPVSAGESLDPVRRPEIYRESVPSADAVVIPGPTTRGIAFIGRLVTAQAELVILGRKGHDLLYRFSIAGRHLALRPPLYVLTGVFAQRDTQEMAIHGSVRDGRVLLRACAKPSECVSRSIPLSASRAWSLVSPIDVTSERLVRALSALFLAFLYVPLGYWSAWWGRGGILVAAAAGVSGLAVLPLALALPIAAAIEWIAVALGLGLGARIAVIVRRRP